MQKAGITNTSTPPIKNTKSTETTSLPTAGCNQPVKMESH
ncbi:MAG: hypothetical protein ACI9XB_004903 [Gammaproteobacteria bacterium]